MSKKQRRGWTELPELPAERVKDIIRGKIGVPVRVAAIALDKHPNTIYKEVKAGSIPTIGHGPGIKISSSFLLEKCNIAPA